MAKRTADMQPPGQARSNDKKQKKMSATLAALLKPSKPSKQAAPEANAAGIVPATPGTSVHLPPSKDIPAAPRTRTQATAPPAKKQNQEPPTTLPLEPHAAILADLQNKYAVRVMSVISSTKMEKRIKAVLDHLGGLSPPPDAARTQATPGPLPGVVLLHARAPDANKLVSIVEIAKRRIREGHFAPAPSIQKDGKKAKTKDAKAKAVAWHQYDRIYDVTTPRKPNPKKDLPPAAGQASGGVVDGEASEEDEDFAPMVHRFEAAVGGPGSSTTVTTTYMSIILSRTPIVELHRHADVSVQSSTDQLEVEYEEYMAGG